MKTLLMILMVGMVAGCVAKSAPTLMQGVASNSMPMQIIADCGMVNGVLVSKPCKQYAEELAKRLQAATARCEGYYGLLTQNGEHGPTREMRIEAGVMYLACREKYRDAVKP